MASQATTPYSMTSDPSADGQTPVAKLASANPIATLALGAIVPPIAKSVLKYALRHPLKAGLGLLLVSTIMGRKMGSPPPSAP